VTQSTAPHPPPSQAHALVGVSLNGSASCAIRCAALVPISGEMCVQVDFLLSRLKVLYERIDDTEDLINIELDHR